MHICEIKFESFISTINNGKIYIDSNFEMIDIDCVLQIKDNDRMLTGGKFNSEPDGHGHAPVMDDMENGNVIVLFSQHKEDCVRKLGELGDVVPPATLCHAQRNRII